jgi:hypothetical protein
MIPTKEIKEEKSLKEPILTICRMIGDVPSAGPARKTSGLWPDPDPRHRKSVDPSRARGKHHGLRKRIQGFEGPRIQGKNLEVKPLEPSNP